MPAIARAFAVLVALSLAACGSSGGDQPPAPACGDRAIDAGEGCDDGNAISGDGCSPACQVESGYLCTGQPSVCAILCGDGLVGGVEQCDDGNYDAGDGCAPTCQVEHGFTCTGQPSACGTICGDGLLAGAEECDDGNSLPGDGCAATCQVESGFTCTGQPSACVQTVQRVDVWEPGAPPPAFQAGFAVGEAAAVTFEPLPRAVTVTAVRLLFGGAAGTRTVTLRIFQDQGVVAPGGLLFEGDFELTAADTALSELAVTVPIPAGQAYRLAVFWQHSGAPSIAHDAGTSVAGANSIFDASGLGWQSWTAMGGTGNFILRAVVQ